MSPPDDGARPVPLAEVARMLAEAQALEPPPTLSDPPPPPEEPPPPDDDGDGDGGGDDGAWSRYLPPDCPVVPLGTMDEVYYYLDSLCQLRALKAKDHSRLNLQSLFGEMAADFLRRHWASFKAVKRKLPDGTVEEDFIITGWKPELVAEALMAEGSAQGVWSPQHRVRGPGAWRGDKGELILHLGDRLLIVGADGTQAETAPGRVGSYVYPSDRVGLRPHGERQPAGEDGPGEKLRRLFGHWTMERGEVDAHLLVGLAVASMIGGALDRRPVHWTTGGYGTGKSTLQDAQRWLHGPGGALQTPDGTAAGVRQTLRYSSFPVWIDEAEAKEDNRRLTALVELARSAYTGALAVRGGNDHQGAGFNLFSVIGFSSILMPPLSPQDMSRMLIIRLRELPKGAKPPPINERRMAKLGSMLLRRVVDGWQRFAPTLEAYREAMAKAGHSARGQDVYGTLLACAHIALYDDAPSMEGDLEPWTERLAAAAMTEAQPEGDEQSCLHHLMTSVVDDPHDKSRRTIAELVRRASNDSGQYGTDIQERAQELLGLVGLRHVTEYLVPYLAVANKSTGLNRLFQGTHWHSAANGTGVWTQSLERLPGAKKPQAGPDGKPRKIRIGGYPSRCQLLPLALCLGDGDSHPHADLPPSGPDPARQGTDGNRPDDGAASHSPPQRLDDPGWPPGPDPSGPDPWPDDGSYPFPDP